MFRYLLRVTPVFTLLLILPARAAAQEPNAAAARVAAEDQISSYGNGDVAVYSTLLTLGGRYSGRAERGQYRALVVWVRRDGRWQQVARQMTPVLGP